MNYSEAKAVLEGRAACNYAAKLRKPSDRDRVKIANHSFLERRGPQTIALKYHATDVLTFTPHYVELNSGGWYTVSTRDRLEYGPCQICADKLGWSVVPRGNAWGDGHPYYDGIRVRNDGTGILKTQPNMPAHFSPARTVSGWSGRPNSGRRGHEPFWKGPDNTPERATAVSQYGAGVSGVVMMAQSDILACPHVIWSPEHYRPDGSCRCNDPAHTEMAEWGYTWDGSEWKGDTDGDIYYYVVTDPCGEHLDSCGGFYGFDYAKGEASEALDDAIESAANRRVEIARGWALAHGLQVPA